MFMPLDEYYKIKFTKMMLVNSVQLGSYDNKCLNAYGLLQFHLLVSCYLADFYVA